MRFFYSKLKFPCNRLLFIPTRSDEISYQHENLHMISPVKYLFHIANCAQEEILDKGYVVVYGLKLRNSIKKILKEVMRWFAILRKMWFLRRGDFSSVKKILHDLRCSFDRHTYLFQPQKIPAMCKFIAYDMRVVCSCWLLIFLKLVIFILQLAIFTSAT